MDEMVLYPEITINLSGVDGNIYAVMGHCSKQLRKGLQSLGKSADEIKNTISEYQNSVVSSGDYHTALGQIGRFANVEFNDDDAGEDTDYYPDYDDYYDDEDDD